MICKSDRVRIVRWFEPWSVWQDQDDPQPEIGDDYWGIGNLWPTHWMPLTEPPKGDE